MKIYRKISVLALAALVVTTGFTSCGEDDLDTNPYSKGGVNILGFGPMPITRGETMRLTGTRLNSVKEVLFPEGNQKLSPSTTYIAGEFSLQNSEEMTVTIPDQCVPGKLRLVLNNGDTIVSKSNITFAEEIKVTSLSPTSVHPGDVVTIKGEYVWNIGEVIFFDHVAVEAEEFLKNTRNEIQVRVPEEAKTGEVQYNDGSDGAENLVAGTLNVDAPKASGISNATPEFGETITITGENLDLVTSMDFPSVKEVSYRTANDGKSIMVTVPENTVSGTITMTAASGLTTTINITMPLATVTGTNPAKDVKAGQAITISGTNLDRILQLVLPGIKDPLDKGDFTQNAYEISFVVPEKMGDGKVTLIQHENYSVESDKITMYSEAPEVVVWSGEGDVSEWGKGVQDLAWGNYDWSQVKAGTQLILYYKKVNPNEWGCMSLRHGTEWGNLPDIPSQYDFEEAEGVIKVTLTQNMLDDMIANNGFVVAGTNFILTKIATPIEETVLWSGATAILWEPTVAVQDLAYGGYDWSNVKPGTTLKLYYEVNPEVGYINIRFAVGEGWKALPSTAGWGNDGNASPDPSETSIKTVLTEEDLEALKTLKGFIVCGAGVICKKIVLL